MDIYSFIESKNIREHCRKLGHQFNTVESAYLVWQSRDTPLIEKHSAWQEIIDTMPDMEWSRNGKAWGSIHRCLERYMELEDRLVEDFFTADELKPCMGTYPSSTDMMYNSIQLLAGDKGVDKIEHSGWYKEMGEHHIIDDTQIWISHDERNLQVNYVVKSSFCKDTFARFVMGSSREVLSQDEVEFMKLFENMWVYVPTPFKTGDLVISDDGIAVLNDWQFCPENREYIERMEREGNCHDMCCRVTDMAKGAYNIRYSAGFYLRLEQYKGERSPKDRFLAALGSYYRSELDIQELLNAYAVFKAAFDLGKLEKDMAQVYSDGMLKKMGLEYLGENGGQE